VHRPAGSRRPSRRTSVSPWLVRIAPSASPRARASILRDRAPPHRPEHHGLGRCALIAGLTTSSAHASGIAVARFGGEHGHPTTDNPTAIYYNPAGIALRPGRFRFFVDGSLAGRWASYTRPESAITNEGTGTPEGASDTNAGTAKVANALFSPFIGATSDFGTKFFTAGAALYFPFGGQAVWNQNTKYSAGDLAKQYPGANDGVQRWHTIDGKVRSMYVTGAIAFNIHQIGLSIGASGSAIRSEVDTIRARNPDGSDDLVDSDGSIKEGRSWLKAKGWQGSFSVGAIWNWRSKAVDRRLVHRPAQRRRRHDPPGQPRQTCSPRPSTRPRPPPSTSPRPSPTSSASASASARPSASSCACSPTTPAGPCLINSASSTATVENRNCDINANKAQDPDNGRRDLRRREGDDSITRHRCSPASGRTPAACGPAPPTGSSPTSRASSASASTAPPSNTQTLDAALLDMHKMSVSLGARWQIVRQFAIALTVTDIAYFKLDTKGRNLLGKFVGTAGQPSADGIYKQNILLGNLYMDVHF
jgi:long-chain fatty acid transport protein